MPRNPAAQTAFGPMILAAMEQREPAERRLVDDDLAARFLPAPTRWLVTATQAKIMRRLMMAAIERSGPGMWANFMCRKRYVADKVTEALDDIDAVVVLGAGLDTLAYRLARKTHIPIFEVETNRSTSHAKPRPCDGCWVSCRGRFGWYRWTLSATTCSVRWPNWATATTTAPFSSGKA
jgi:hypothetical protein